MGHRRRVLGVAPSPEIDPPVDGYPERVGRGVAGHQHCGGHIHVHDRGHQFRVRVADHPVAGGRSDDLLHPPKGREPGVGIGRRHRRQRGEKLAEGAPVLLQPGTEMGPVGVLEQGEGEPGLEDAVGHLAGMGEDVEGEPPPLGRRVAPRRLAPLLGQASLGGQRFAADHQGQIEVAAQDVPSDVGDDRLGDIAADPRVVGHLRVGAQLRGQAAGGVVVLPGLAVDDVDPLEPLDGAGVAGVGIRETGDFLPHGQRFRRAIGAAFLGVPGPSAHPDQAGLPRVPLAGGGHVRVRTAGPGPGA